MNPNYQDILLRTFKTPPPETETYTEPMKLAPHV